MPGPISLAASRLSRLLVLAGATAASWAAVGTGRPDGVLGIVGMAEQALSFAAVPTRDGEGAGGLVVDHGALRQVIQFDTETVGAFGDSDVGADPGEVCGIGTEVHHLLTGIELSPVTEFDQPSVDRNGSTFDGDPLGVAEDVGCPIDNEKGTPRNRDSVKMWFQFGQGASQIQRSPQSPLTSLPRPEGLPCYELTSVGRAERPSLGEFGTGSSRPACLTWGGSGQLPLSFTRSEWEPLVSLGCVHAAQRRVRSGWLVTTDQNAVGVGPNGFADCHTPHRTVVGGML